MTVHTDSHSENGVPSEAVSWWWKFVRFFCWFGFGLYAFFSLVALALYRDTWTELLEIATFLGFIAFAEIAASATLKSNTNKFPGTYFGFMTMVVLLLVLQWTPAWRSATLVAIISIALWFKILWDHRFTLDE